MNQKTTQQIYPELPEWSKRDDLGGLVPSEVRQALRTYADETCAARGAAASKPQVKEARERRRWLSDSFNRGTQTLYEVTGDIKDINTMLVPRAALAAPAQAAPANEALKNAALPWPWKTDAEVLDDAISAIEGQNRLKAALRSIAARTTPAAAPVDANVQEDAERYRWLRDNQNWQVLHRIRPGKSIEYRMREDGDWWGS